MSQSPAWHQKVVQPSSQYRGCLLVYALEPVKAARARSHPCGYLTSGTTQLCYRALLFAFIELKVSFWTQASTVNPVGRVRFASPCWMLHLLSSSTVQANCSCASPGGAVHSSAVRSGAGMLQEPSKQAATHCTAKGWQFEVTGIADVSPHEPAGFCNRDNW